MCKIEVTTMNGHRYIVHAPAGYIERTDMAFTPTHQWRMVGLVETRYNRFAVPVTSLGAWINCESSPVEWLYKNGKPRYTVMDYDHGSHRTWGDGIRSMRIIANECEDA